jgi:hypothetical protein
VVIPWLHLCQDTQLYYEVVGLKLTTNGANIFTYLLRVEELLIRESERCELFLHSQTVQKVRLICLNALIVAHSEYILKELTDAIKDLALSILPNEINQLRHAALTSQLSPLKSIFHLFVTIHSALALPSFLRFLSSELYRFAVLLTNSFQMRFKDASSGALRFDKSATITYVQGVIVILVLITDMCASLFDEDPLFVQSAKKASKAIINTDIDGTVNVVDLYAAYCDSSLQVVNPAARSLF